MTFFFEELCKCTSVPNPDLYVFGPPRSASESVSQRYGSEYPDPHPDPYKCHGSPTPQRTNDGNCRLPLRYAHDVTLHILCLETASHIQYTVGSDNIVGSTTLFFLLDNSAAEKLQIWRVPQAFSD